MSVTLLIRIGFSIAVVVTTINQTLSIYTEQFLWLIIILIGMGAAIDIVNTVLLCLFMEKNHNPLLRYVDMSIKDPKY
jgi:hypothetical protein